jgi:uncharacterized protein YjbI with pentapeptide repeats
VERNADRGRKQADRFRDRLRRWVDRWGAVIQTFSVVLGLAGVAISTYQIRMARVSERDAAEDGAKARRYQAWQTMIAAQGLPGNGGRIQALEELNVDHTDMRGADLRYAWLAGVQLFPPNARLIGADFRHAILSEANLHTARLEEAKLDSAFLFRADLSGAFLSGASLRNADLSEADLRDAVLKDAGYPPEQRTNMQGAILRDADLRRADFRWIQNLSRQQLLEARDWRGARLPWPEVELPDGATGAELESLRFRVFRDIVKSGEWVGDSILGSPVIPSVQSRPHDD